jgi:hypothetical protein
LPARNEPHDVFKLYNMSGGPLACWPWIGAWSGGGNKQGDRHPFFMAGRRRIFAYRWVYELVNGVTLTPDMMILHSCDNGGHPVGCGNPSHMRIGDHKENAKDRSERQRQGLSHFVVRAIRKLLEDGRSQDEIAALYGVNRSVISGIATKRSYQAID